jgi:hypothetical protein
MWERGFVCWRSREADRTSPAAADQHHYEVLATYDQRSLVFPFYRIPNRPACPRTPKPGVGRGAHRSHPAGRPRFRTSSTRRSCSFRAIARVDRPQRQRSGRGPDRAVRVDDRPATVPDQPTRTGLCRFRDDGVKPARAASAPSRSTSPAAAAGGGDHPRETKWPRSARRARPSPSPPRPTSPSGRRGDRHSRARLSPAAPLDRPRPAPAGLQPAAIDIYPLPAHPAPDGRLLPGL